MPRKPVSRQNPSSKRTTDRYSQNWVKWVIIYLLVGGLIYLAIYALFFQKGYSDLNGQKGSETEQNSLYQ